MAETTCPNSELEARNEKIAALRIKSTHRLRRTYTNFLHPHYLSSLYPTNFYLDKKAGINNKLLGYVGKTSYTDSEILVPYLLEDILYYTHHPSGLPQVDPELDYWPIVANIASKPHWGIGKEFNFEKEPKTAPKTPTIPLDYPFIPKYRDNLRSFTDEDGTHFLHTSGELMNDICISDLYKYGNNIKKLATYKCPINCPGDVYQLQLSEDLKDYRLMINQMYSCSIVDIIRQGPKEYNFKPIEILQYSKKIADSTMFKPTGSVVVLSETGEITFWNGGETVRMLHKPRSEVPKYVPWNYSHSLRSSPIKMRVPQRCTFVESPNSILVSTYKDLFSFDFRENSTYSRPILTLKDTIFGLKNIEFDAFQFVLTTASATHRLDLRFLGRPMESWKVLLESDPTYNIQFLPKNENCIENPYNSVITWSSPGEILLSPYDSKYNIYQDVVLSEKTPLLVPSFNSFAQFSYIGMYKGTTKANKISTARQRYSPDVQLNGVSAIWYKQIHSKLEDSGDESEGDDYISQSHLLLLQLSTSGDLYTEIFSFENNESLNSDLWCDFKAREEVVLRRVELNRINDTQIWNVYNLMPAFIDIVNRSLKLGEYAQTTNSDRDNMIKLLNSKFDKIEEFLTGPKSISKIKDFIQSILYKDIEIEIITEFLMKRSTILRSKYFNEDRYRKSDPLYKLPFNPDAELYVYRIMNLRSNMKHTTSGDLSDEEDNNPDEFLFTEEPQTPPHSNNNNQNEIDYLYLHKKMVKEKLRQVSLMFWSKSSFHKHFSIGKTAPREKQTLKINTAELNRLKSLNVITKQVNFGILDYELDIGKLQREWEPTSPSVKLQTPIQPSFMTPSSSPIPSTPLSSSLSRNPRMESTPSSYLQPPTPFRSSTPRGSNTPKTPNTPKSNTPNKKAKLTKNSEMESDLDSLMSFIDGDK